MEQQMCTQFEPTTNTSSATKCKWCGQEKFMHEQITMAQQTDHIGDTNKMVTMKLYTEEQVTDMLHEMKWKHKLTDEQIEYWIQDMIPIKLPNDEEIEERYYIELEERREVAKNFTGQVAGRHPDMFGHNEVHHMARGYMECIKWIREQMLNK